jgi:hypothetical protein
MSEKERVWKSLKKKIVFLSVFLGVLIALIVGFIENPPRVGYVDATYYGYPFIWRVVKSNSNVDVRYFYLFIDAIFWFAVSLLALIVMHNFYYREPSYE